MEHRNGERINVVLPASLRQGRHFLGWFTTRDISRTGLALHGTAPGLANNSIITVTIETRNGGNPVLQDYRALVVRQQPDCLGLMWVEDDIDLKPLLSAPPDVSTSRPLNSYNFQQMGRVRPRDS